MIRDITDLEGEGEPTKLIATETTFPQHSSLVMPATKVNLQYDPSIVKYG